MTRICGVAMLFLSSAGCQPNTISGELGRAEFMWSFCPPTGCEATPALARGAVARLDVTSTLPEFDVSSTDASILAGSILHPRDAQERAAIGISALRNGTAKLTLTDRTSQEVIDRLPLTVVEPSTITITYPAPGWSIALMGGPIRIGVALHDPAGHPLIASRAVTYSPDPGVVVEPIDDPSASDDAVKVSCAAPGTSMLALTSGDASVRLEITSVEPKDIGRVAFSPIDAHGASIGTGGTTTVAAGAFLADGSVVYAPRLSWASSNPDCVQVEDPAPRVSSDVFDHVDLRASTRGCVARIIAIAGSASAAIDVQTQ